jgi:peroxiredoxin
MSKKIKLLTAIVIILNAGLPKAHALVNTQDSLPVLDRQAPDFRLKDQDGKAVSLSDFKGKVVVLDFWATWCVPCQQSFPGMQKALNHYTGNSEVVFLFMDTRETAPNYKDLAKAQMKKNNYSFHVIFDETGPGGLQNKQYLIYNMPGIPTKYIIDAKGIIRYQLIGFNPKQSADDNAAEIISLVERTKAIGN